MKTTERFTHKAVEAIRAYIEESGGNEVLLRGTVNPDKIVEEVEAGAFGNEYSAPAILSFMERGDVVIHNHPGGNLTPSDADISVASRLANEGIGFFIIDNDVENVYIVCEAVVPIQKVELDSDNLAGILHPGGPLSQMIEDYEFREPQAMMLENILQAFNTNKIAVIEAGTGVGKSMAYLLPALKWAEKNQERIVISTATINLQQQLTEKDVPLAKKLLGSDLKTVLVKGRGNYICLRRLAEAEDMQITLFEDDENEIKEIAEWSKNTATGCKSDLSFVPTYSNWSKVCSEADNCLGMKCPVRERCFVMKVRKEASTASVLIVNHHLLFSDLAMRSDGAGYSGAAVLPSFSKIVFDEAHNIENSATGFFSKVINKFAINKLAGRIYTARGSKRFGLIKSLRDAGVKKELLEKIPAPITDLKSCAEELTTALFTAMEEKRQFIYDDDEDRAITRLTEDYLTDLNSSFLKIMNVLNEILSQMDDQQKESSAALELNSTAMRLQAFMEACTMFSNREDYPNNVFFMEKKFTAQGDFFIELTASPIDISGKMRDAVNDAFDSVIYTSATLSINENFNYFMGRNGLIGYDSERLLQSSFKSPFPYRTNVLLGIPTDAPGPFDQGYTGYIAETVKKALEITKGSGLVLFTSYKLMQDVYEEIGQQLIDQGIPVMIQGEMERSKLLNTFNSDISSVLFATSSFWEGVDSPGQTLQLVIITKLPFKVPTEPVFKARIKHIEAKGGNSFISLSVPDAAMKLKQGFGRLMRKKTDIGSVLILDPRIVQKQYGKTFIKSLPQTCRSIRSSEEVLQNLDLFFETRIKKYQKAVETE